MARRETREAAEPSKAVVAGSRFFAACYVFAAAAEQAAVCPSVLFRIALPAPPCAAKQVVSPAGAAFGFRTCAVAAAPTGGPHTLSTALLVPTTAAANG